MKSLLTSFFSFLKKKKFPTKEDLTEIKNQPFSLYKGLLIFSCSLVFFLLLGLLTSISNHFSIEKPDYGGTLSFGVIGAPRFINPLLSSSETDQSLSYLAYAGLVKDIGHQKELEPVLASRFIASPDGKQYRFTLKEGVMFSDKTPLTSNDVVFTFETKKHLALLADPASNWSNILVEAPDSNTVVISTTGDSNSLIEKLSLGIVPKALWENIDIGTLEDSTLNTHPVGAGPFMVSHINYSNSVPKEVIFKRNTHFTGTKPYLKEVKIRIFANQLELADGLKSGAVESTNMLGSTFIDESMKNDLSIIQTPTEKSVSIFANQPSQSNLSVGALTALDGAIDRKKIIDIIENGYGIPLYNPLGTSTTDSTEILSVLAKLGYKQDESGKLLKSGSQINIPIVVRKDDQLLQITEELSQELSRYGVSTEFKVFDQGLFTDQVNGGSYPFILATETDVPSNYRALTPLYKRVIPTITTKQIHPYLPLILRTRAQIFAEIEHWYVRTDKVWKWFK